MESIPMALPKYKISIIYVKYERHNMSCNHGRHAMWHKWRAWGVTQVKQRKAWRMSCDVGKETKGLENELWHRWSDGKVGEWAAFIRMRVIVSH